jgi:threonine/homoserine/homoserine lactone efflux protein
VAVAVAGWQMVRKEEEEEEDEEKKELPTSRSAFFVVVLFFFYSNPNAEIKTFFAEIKTFLYIYL